MSTSFKIIRITNNDANEADVHPSGQSSTTCPGDDHVDGLEIFVPECGSSGEFAENNVQVALDGIGGNVWFWQIGDKLYYSTNGTWNNTQEVSYSGTVKSNRVNPFNLVITESDDQTWIMGSEL